MKGSRLRPISDFAVDSKQFNGKVYYKNRKGTWFTATTRKGFRKFVYYKESVCLTCQNYTLIDATNFKRGKRRYCSRACWSSGNTGNGNPLWTGGRRLIKSGYCLAYSPNNPNAVRGYVQEHRLVVEKNLGRFLTKKELVHHIDCVKNNNDLSNLIVLSSSQHHASHASLESCVSSLLQKGVLIFNHEKFIYEVSK